MTDEAAKQLAEAMNRLAAAIERMMGGGATLSPGVQVYHHGLPQQSWPAWQHPQTTWGGAS